MGSASVDDWQLDTGGASARDQGIVSGIEAEFSAMRTDDGQAEMCAAGVDDGQLYTGGISEGPGRLGARVPQRAAVAHPPVVALPLGHLLLLPHLPKY